MSSPPLKAALGPPIDDASEETFFLFSQEIPSNNLGFIDSKADTLELEIGGHDYVLRQSPGLLTSHRNEGTTGAVLWKITPLLATWLAPIPPILAGTLHNEAVVVELGCGIAGLIGLVLSRFVQCYILTDQDYVMKYLRENISANTTSPQDLRKSSRRRKNVKAEYAQKERLMMVTLDWERDSAQNLKTAIPVGSSIDILVLCDCVYNEYLIGPLVQTCVDICRLGPSRTKATVVLIAQQLRSNTVFELFLDSLMKEFLVWRVPDEKISTELCSGSGYAVHLAMLKELDANAE